MSQHDEGLSAEELGAEGVTALPDKEVVSILDLNADIDLAIDAAAPIDLALLVPDGVRAADIERVIRSNGGELLERLTLFDEFRGAGLPPGTRSLAWRLTFRDATRTLRDKEIEGRTNKILRALEGELGVRQRTA